MKLAIGTAILLLLFGFTLWADGRGAPPQLQLIPALAQTKPNSQLYVLPPIPQAQSGTLLIYKVRGDSMEPILPQGSYVLAVANPDPKSLKVGHIIIAEIGGRLVGHQIVEIYDDGGWWALTAGSNRPTTERVEAKNLRAWVIGVLW